MPSRASTTSTPERRFNANTSSCRMVGLSSTIRMRCRAMACSRLFRQELDEPLHGVELALGMPVQLRREDRGGRVGGQQREQLMVEPAELLLLHQQREGGDRADGARSDAQRGAAERLVGRVRGERLARQDLGRGHRGSHQTLTERDRGEARPLAALRGYRRQQQIALVKGVDAQHLGADQVDHDLDDDAQDLRQVERRVQLVAGHVQVGEAVVLLLDLEEALRELAVLRLERLEPVERVLALALEALDARHQLLAQPVPRLRVCAGVVLPRLQLEQFAPQARVLLHELAGELRSAAEHRQELARALEQLSVPLAHLPPLAGPASPAAKPDWINSAIPCSGTTASTA